MEPGVEAARVVELAAVLGAEPAAELGTVGEPGVASAGVAAAWAVEPGAE